MAVKTESATAWTDGRRLGAVIAAMSDVVVVVGEDRDVLFIGDAARAVLGIEPAEWHGRDIIDLVVEADRARALVAWEQTLLLPGRKRPLQVRIQSASGAVVLAEAIANNQLENPAIRGVVLSLRRLDARDDAATSLHVAQEQFRLAFGMSLVGMAIVGLDQRFLAVNETLCRLVGRSEYELLRLSPADVTHPDDQDQTAAFAGRLQSGPSGFIEAEKRYLRPDGTVVPVIVSASIVRDRDGQPLYFVGQVEDLSRQRAAEESALRAGAELRSLAATLPIGIYRADARGRCVYANDRWSEIYGVAPDDAGGFGWIQAMHPDDRDECLAQVAHAGESDEPFDASFRVCTQNGQLRTVHATATAVRGPTGELIGYSGSVEDITTSVRSAERLDDANRRFSAAFANAPIGMALVGLDGRWLDVNRSLTAMLGYTSEQLMAMTFQDVTHPDDLDTDLEFVRQVVDREIDGYSMEKRYFDRSGQIVWVNLSVSLVVDTADEPMYFISQIEDITERKRSEVELRESTERLARSNRDLEEFASVAAHDLAEPLRVIEGYLHVLRHRCVDRLDDDSRGFIDHAVDGAERLQQLIDDLLEYSRSTSTGLDIRYSSLDGIVSDALASLSTSIAESHADVEVAALPTVSVDPRLMTLVVQNLVANALKFVQPGSRPRVYIAAEVDEAGWTLTVADNGIGIPLLDRERIFKMFKRLHARDAYPGTGIGLAICKQIVERHGGRIWAADVAAGTAIRAWFPAGRGLTGNEIS